MHQFKHWLDQILETGVIITSFLMIGIVTLQILGRFILPWSPPWTEEAARYAFIFMVSLGAGLALRDNAYVRVEYFLNWFPPYYKQIVEIFILACIILITGLLSIYTIPLVNIVSIQYSSALQISMAWVYAAMFILGFFTFIYGIIAIRKKINSNPQNNNAL